MHINDSIVGTIFFFIVAIGLSFGSGSGLTSSTTNGPFNKGLCDECDRYQFCFAARDGIDFDAYIWKSVTLRSTYTYTDQDLGNGNSQSFQNWDASLAYRKDRDSKWEFELKATNILNIDAQVRNSANNVSVFVSETFIQPRFITGRVVYTL